MKTNDFPKDPLVKKTTYNEILHDKSLGDCDVPFKAELLSLSDYGQQGLQVTLLLLDYYWKINVSFDKPVILWDCTLVGWSKIYTKSPHFFIYPFLRPLSKPTLHLTSTATRFLIVPSASTLTHSNMISFLHSQKYLFKHKFYYILSLLKTLQWVPISLRIKSKFLILL